MFLAVGETLGTGPAFAAKYHYEVDADQELLAMGAANVSSGLFQGITIDMSLSSTASGEAAGERTQLSSLVSAGVILAVVVFLAPLLRNLPSAVLGAIVLSSILGLFNFRNSGATIASARPISSWRSPRWRVLWRRVSWRAW